VETRREREALRVTQGGVAAGRAGEQAADHSEGRLAARCRQQQGELVAADPERAIRGSADGADQPADGGEQPVPRGVAVGVVESLQVVEVEDREGQRAPLAGGIGHLAGQLLLERAVVAEAGSCRASRVADQGRPREGLPEAREGAHDVTHYAGGNTAQPPHDHDEAGRYPGDHQEAAAAIAPMHAIRARAAARSRPFRARPACPWQGH
jgi:hypothetical protein